MAGNYKNDDIEAQNDAAESGEVSETRTESDKTDGEDYEKVCFVCHRPESKAGKMITMPGGITICSDCMQRAFDSFEKTECLTGSIWAGQTRERPEMKMRMEMDREAVLIFPLFPICRGSA